MSLDELLKHFKTKRAIAKAVGVKPPSVSEWFSEGAVPQARQWQIQLLTGGVLQADAANTKENA